VAEPAARTLELERRFGFEWLSIVADSVRVWAAAVGSEDAEGALAALESRLDEVTASGRRCSRSSFLLWISDIRATQGRTAEAEELLRRARQDPGPYQQLLVDLVDRRLARLSRE
jgi:hypothetical protein